MIKKNSNTPKSRVESKHETNKKIIVYDFLYTCLFSWKQSKYKKISWTWKSVEHLSNYLIRKKENREERKRDRENEEKIIDVDIDWLVVQVV